MIIVGIGSKGVGYGSTSTAVTEELDQLEMLPVTLRLLTLVSGDLGVHI